MAASVFDLLVEEHREILATLDALEQGGGEHPADVLEQLIALVTMHHAAEEDLVHPLLVQFLGERTTAPHEDAQEHGLVEVLLAETRAHAPGSAAMQGCLAVLRRLVTDHFQREESELFPALRAGLEPGAATALAERYVAHEASLRGPDEAAPHAEAPVEPTHP